MTDKWLYIPVEVKVREFQAKVLLAAEAARRGYKVVLGRKAEIMNMIGPMPRGTFFGLWAQENFLDVYKDLKERGFVTMVMDEEGLVTFSDDIYRNLKLSDATLSHVDHFLTWGAYQKGVLEQCRPATPPQLHPTGNIRFDILRPELRHLFTPEVQAIKNQHGPFIMLVSSFSLSNHFSGAGNYFDALIRNKVIQNEEDNIFLRRYMKLQGQIFEAMVAAVPAIEKDFPDHKIIIRPHPSEDFNVWREALKSSPNVHVIHEGSIHPWLMASDAVIHHFCTTSLESFACQVPSIAFRPFKDRECETDLPYHGSLEARNVPELLAHLKKLITLKDSSDLDRRREQARPVLKTYIGNLEGEFSFTRTMDIIDRHAPDSDARFPVQIFLMFWTLRSQALNLYRVTRKTLLGDKGTYVDHKFISVSQKEIENLIADMARAFPAINNTKVDQVAPFCFIISHPESTHEKA